MSRLNGIFLFIASAMALHAQEYRGTITGRVIDAQDAVIPGAKITATNVNTGSRSETVSGHDGQYTIPFLPPGEYRIIVESQGFKRYVREGFSVGAGEREALDIKLEVGQVSDSVTITAESPLLETASASAGRTDLFPAPTAARPRKSASRLMPETAVAPRSGTSGKRRPLASPASIPSAAPSTRCLASTREPTLLN